MNKIKFQTKQATTLDIEKHLVECDDFFVPPLSNKVNIKTYSKKIYDFAITFEAWEESRLVGLIAVYFNDISTKIGFITNVSVSPNCLGKGIAKKLLKLSKEYAKNQFYTEIKLEVDKNNLKAISLYKKNGFELIPEELNNNLVFKHKVV